MMEDKVHPESVALLDFFSVFFKKKNYLILWKKERVSEKESTKGGWAEEKEEKTN